MNGKRMDEKKKYGLAVILLLVTIAVLALHGCRSDEGKSSVPRGESAAESDTFPADIATEAESEAEGAITTEAESEAEEVITTEAKSEAEEVITTEAESEAEEVITTEVESEAEEAITTEVESEVEEAITMEAESETEEAITMEAESEAEEAITMEVESEAEEVITTEAKSEAEEVITTEVESEVEEASTTEAESRAEEATTAQPAESDTWTGESEPELESLTVETRAAEYVQGYELSYGDLIVTAHYSDGADRTVSGYGIVQEDGKLWVIYGSLKSHAIQITYRPAVVSVSAALRRNHYYLHDTLSAEDFIVTVTYSDGKEKTVSEGVSLMDRSGGTPVERENVVICEFVNGVYMKNGYALSVVVEGGESPAVFVSWHYRETVATAPEMLALVNGARRENGLDELVWDPAAEAAALTRAGELTEQYSHERPDGTGAGSLYEKVWGENINTGTYREADSLQRIFNSWMASPGHRACILDATEAAGFACAFSIVTDEDGYGTGYWVMLTTRK